jgi:hypothetical protein
VLTETRACERLRARSYDPTSFHPLTQIVTADGGYVVADWQVAFITSRPRADGRLLDRQHVMPTDSGTVLIETAFMATSSHGINRKVYWHSLEPTPAGVRMTTLDKYRTGHHVSRSDVGSYWWLTTTSLVAPS